MGFRHQGGYTWTRALIDDVYSLFVSGWRLRCHLILFFSKANLQGGVDVRHSRFLTARKEEEAPWEARADATVRLLIKYAEQDLENFRTWVRSHRQGSKALTREEVHSAQALGRYINEHAVCTPTLGVAGIVLAAMAPVLLASAGLGVLYFAALGVMSVSSRKPQ
jgi:hypothetical protein